MLPSLMIAHIYQKREIKYKYIENYKSIPYEKRKSKIKLLLIAPQWF